MSRLDEFLRLLCGRFDNTRQLEELRRSGGPALPLAEHVNTVCNDKIDGLPAEFAGAFVLEESYYTTEGKTHASPHLFLFTEEGEAVKLTSYQLPKAAADSRSGLAIKGAPRSVTDNSPPRVWSSRFCRRSVESGPIQ